MDRATILAVAALRKAKRAKPATSVTNTVIREVHHVQQTPVSIKDDGSTAAALSINRAAASKASERAQQAWSHSQESNSTAAAARAAAGAADGLARDALTTATEARRTAQTAAQEAGQAKALASDADARSVNAVALAQTANQEAHSAKDAALAVIGRVSSIGDPLAAVVMEGKDIFSLSTQGERRKVGTIVYPQAVYMGGGGGVGLGSIKEVSESASGFLFTRYDGTQFTIGAAMFDDYTSVEYLDDQTSVGAVRTFTFLNGPVQKVWIELLAADADDLSVARVRVDGLDPDADTGTLVHAGQVQPISSPPTTTVKVLAPSGKTITCYGYRR